MIKISTADARTLRRLLGRLQGVAGNDVATKNARRQAALLDRVLKKKINDGKAGVKLL